MSDPVIGTVIDRIAARVVAVASSTLVTAFALGAGAAAAVSPATPDDDPLVTVWRVVPANYHDGNFDKETLAKLLLSTPLRKEHVNAGDTVSSVLQRKLNISAKHTPAVYDEVVTYVLNSNAMGKPEDLRAGATLKIPDLPRTTKLSAGLKNPFAGMPARTASAPAFDLKDFAILPKTESSVYSGSVASTKTRQLLTLRKSELDALQLIPSNASKGALSTW